MAKDPSSPFRRRYRRLKHTAVFLHVQVSKETRRILEALAAEDECGLGAAIDKLALGAEAKGIGASEAAQPNQPQIFADERR
jgi:hypothetical protein